MIDIPLYILLLLIPVAVYIRPDKSEEANEDYRKKITLRIKENKR